MYTADALRSELDAARAALGVSLDRDLRRRSARRRRTSSPRRSEGGAPLAVMLDHDGQRPEALDAMHRVAGAGAGDADGCGGRRGSWRARWTTLRRAAEKHVAHALVLMPEADASDGPTSEDRRAGTGGERGHVDVVHPTTDSVERRSPLARWLERATAVHGDVRLLPRLPEPTGMR